MPHDIRTVLYGAVVARVLLACTSGTTAQQAPPALDAAMRQQVIDGAIEHMQRAYIFEDVAAKMAAAQAPTARSAAAPPKPTECHRAARDSQHSGVTVRHHKERPHDLTS
ncbi:MAG TPA: hypothetical protein VM364_02650 [Vicinamibacterales bacterium]|nr:hypothetical protein [Vicinamibacterales bacterium]